MTSPLRTHRLNLRTLVLLALGIVLPLLVVGELAEDLLEKERFRLEVPIMDWIHAHAGTTLTRVSLSLHELGGPLTMSFLVLLVAALLYQQRYRAEALLALLGIGGTVLITAAMKLVFDRSRPELWPRLVEETGASFPSGHSAAAAALATFVVIVLWGTRWRWPALLLALAYTLLMGYSRMVLGVHLPTDVLAGWMTGLATVSGVYRLMRRRIKAQGAGRLPLPTQHAPAADTEMGHLEPEKEAPTARQ